MPEITPELLDLLRRKERAHDDYLAGLRATRAVAARYDMAARSDRPDLYAVGFADGYRQHMRDLEEAIVIADRESHAAMVAEQEAADAASAF